MSPRRRASTPEPPDEPVLSVRGVLRWIYTGRVIVGLSVYGTAVLLGNVWGGGDELVDPAVHTLSVLALASVGLLTPVAYWYSHHRPVPPGPNFFALQAAFDILLVTGVVHIAGGPDSVLAPLLYIALVSGYALLFALSHAVTVALATGVAYLTDVTLAYPELLDAGVIVQVGIFTAVACASGLIGGKLREVRDELTSLERQLRRLHLGTSDILRAIDSGVVTLDRDGRPVYLNPAAEDLLGLHAGDWLDEDLLAELEARAPAVAAAVRETFRTGRPVRNQDAEVSRAEEADHLPVAASTQRLERPDGPPLTTLVLQDMRMARQLEELHLRAGRLQAVAELSASLAHEIKNPLASIRSAVEQLAGAVPDDEESAVLSRLIVREADRLSRLLGEFNDFARVDVIARKPLDVRQLVEEAIELVRQRPEAADRAEFEVEIDEPLDDLWGDPDLVHRTLVNLLLNAVQVAAQHDRPVNVRVVADALRPDQVPRQISPGLPVRIRVIDDGPGIAPEDLERIFDPFYTRREGGSGMGLAIAHRAIHAHGGALLVSSEPGRGATFVIVLPRRDWSERREMERQGWPEGSAREEATQSWPGGPALEDATEGSPIGHE